MSIYIGYRLFLSVPHLRDSEGRIEFPGGGSVYLARLGPGAFFALFGAIVLVASLSYSISYEQPSQSGAPNAAVKYTGVGQQPTPDSVSALATANLPPPEFDSMMLLTDLGYLNHTLPQLTDDKLTPDDRDDLQIILSRAKLGLLRHGWREAWGDFDQFEAWIDSGAPDPVPPDLKDPAALFFHAMESRP